MSITILVTWHLLNMKRNDITKALLPLQTIHCFITKQHGDYHGTGIQTGLKLWKTLRLEYYPKSLTLISPKCFKLRFMQSRNVQEHTIGELPKISRFKYYQATWRPYWVRKWQRGCMRLYQRNENSGKPKNF